MSVLFLAAGGNETGGLEFWFSSTGTVSADNTLGEIGPYAYKCDGAAGATAFLQKNTILNANSNRLVIRFRVSALPASSVAILGIYNSSTASIFQVRIKLDGVMQALATGGATTDSGITISVDTWYSLEVAFNIVSASDYDFKFWIDGTLGVTLTEAGGTLTNTGADRIRCGWLASPGASNKIFRFETVYIDDDSSLADPGASIRCTAKASSTNNVDGFDTTLGTGAVNERPISETNGKQHAATSAAEQTYNLESVSSGDEDITGLTLHGCQGWIRAKKGGGGGTPTDNISFDGADTGITLTTASSTFLKVLTQGTYPSNAKGIGLNRTVGAAPDAFLYDCGAVIAYTAGSPPEPPPATDQAARLALLGVGV